MADVTKRKAMPSLSEQKIGVDEEEEEHAGFTSDLILFLDFAKQRETNK